MKPWHNIKQLLNPWQTRSSSQQTKGDSQQNKGDSGQTKGKNENEGQQQQKQEQNNSDFKISFKDTGFSLKNISLSFLIPQSSLWRWLFGIGLGLIVSGLLLAVSFEIYYRNRFYQGINIDQTAVGGLTKQEALTRLQNSSKDQQPPNIPVVIQYQEYSQTLNLPELTTQKNYQQAVDTAFNIGRSGSPLQRAMVILNLLQKPEDVRASYAINTALIETAAAQLKNEIDQPGRLPEFELLTSGDPNSLRYTEGEDRYLLAVDPTLNKVVETLQNSLNSSENLNSKDKIEIEAVVSHTSQTLSEEELNEARQKALNLVGQFLSFTSQDIEEDQLPDHPTITKTINDQQLFNFLYWPDGRPDFKKEEIRELVEEWGSEIEQPATNAVFEYDPQTLQVEEFSPHQYGLELNLEQTEQQIIDWLQAAIDSAGSTKTEDGASPESQNNTLNLKLQKKEAERMLRDTNDLGINELIGFGETYYYHSIPARVHNVAVTADKLSLTIIPPGEEFSFVETIGPVNGETGYKQAYVIRNGSTLLEFGGGVCQVSTTTFRALLNAGLDITRRLPHSYRVSYYEINRQPGFDATVYTGSVDLRFINDTPGHLLIYSQAESENRYMTVEIYGTDDGRTTEIKNYKKYGYTAPPEPEYIPEESLAPGEVKQVENAVAGIKASFDWVVKDADGEIIREKTFYSNYQAWGAKYLVGE